jgi:hypothetical protein
VQKVQKFKRHDGCTAKGSYYFGIIELPHASRLDCQAKISRWPSTTTTDAPQRGSNVIFACAAWWAKQAWQEIPALPRPTGAGTRDIIGEPDTVAWSAWRLWQVT